VIAFTRCGRQIGKIAKMIKQTALRLSPHQTLVRVLAVNIHQLLADFFQLLIRRAAAIDEGARPAIGLYSAAKENNASSPSSDSVEPAGDCRQLGEIEVSADFRPPLPARTTPASARSPSAKRASASMRTDLPAPVSRSSTVKPGANSSSSAVDDDKVANGKT